jgi:hypothetical protein
VRHPDPALDPVAYNKLCQQTPTAPDCSLPLYWPAPPQILKTDAGMHRFTWDMHYDPIPGAGGGGRGGGGGGGAAVPHRTYPGVNSPWVAPGKYTVRLTANGQSITQPIEIKLDPRVKITPEVQQIFTITTRVEDEAHRAQEAYKEARELIGKVKNEAVIKKLEDLAPAAAAPSEGGGRGGRGAAAEPPAPPNLSNIAGQLVASVQGMQAAEWPPTVIELQGVTKSEAAYTALMAKWNALKATAK